MSDDLVKRAEAIEAWLRLYARSNPHFGQSLTVEAAADLIRDLLADRRETALQYLSDMGQADERLDAAVKQSREDAFREAMRTVQARLSLGYSHAGDAAAFAIGTLITKDTTK